MKSVMNLLDGVMMAGLAEAMALTEQVWPYGSILVVL